jgi:BirA family biotin operon repressor/biotin-[acetyl-CoA-carboxylase] ligase
VNGEPPSGRAAGQPLPAPVAADDLAAYCAASSSWPRGWTVHYAAVTASTQELVCVAAAAGAAHGTVYLADWQQAGRGRRGRVWSAPPGSSLLFSILVRESRLAPFAQTAVCTLALCRVLERSALLPRIKWPNDVMLGDRKVAGVLTERVSGAGTPYQMVGIGLNVNYGARRDTLPPFATALDWEAGRSFERGPLLGALLNELAPLLAEPGLAWETALYGEWLGRLWRRRQSVRLSVAEQTVEGVVEGATAEGALLLRLPTGTLRRISVGEVLL